MADAVITWCYFKSLIASSISSITSGLRVLVLPAKSFCKFLSRSVCSDLPMVMMISICRETESIWWKRARTDSMASLKIGKADFFLMWARASALSNALASDDVRTLPK